MILHGAPVVHDSEGAFSWVRTGGGAGDDGVSDVKAVSGGGAVACGNADSRRPAFEDGERLADASSSGFVVRYLGDGSLLWAVRAGIESGDQAQAVAAAQDGGAFVVGEFVQRFAPDGAILWSVPWDGNLLGAAAMPDGGLAATGVVREGADNEADVLLVRLDADGGEIWRARAGGDGRDRGVEVAVAPDGAVHVAGFFGGPATFGQGECAVTVAAQGRGDAFLARYQP